MSEAQTQSLKNHARFVPPWHFVTAPLLTAYLGWAIQDAFRHPSAESFIHVGLGVALALIFVYARNFALVVQDRVIRLEERLRLERLLPAELKSRIGELSAAQLVALRFASDAELAELTRRVLAGELVGPGAIKRAIREWRPDYLRV